MLCKVMRGNGTDMWINNVEVRTIILRGGYYEVAVAICER